MKLPRTVFTFACSVVFLLPASLMQAQSPLLTGDAAFTDWNQQTPGVRHKITLADLPQPKQEESVMNFPTVIPRPKFGFDTQDHQMVIWADIETAKPEHMRISFSQSRQGISADCVAHNTIVESFNDNNRYGATLELFDYNFNPDIAEKKLPTEYPDEPPSE